MPFIQIRLITVWRKGICVIAAFGQRISQSGQDIPLGGTSPVVLFLRYRPEWLHSSSSSELEVKIPQERHHEN
jgi:hypothetical protein